MYLEKVKINGFKSYARGTGVDFKPGIGVIIGNNGAGKSNILDAIAWALGESDLDRLRCSRYEDLFFNGAAEFPRAETARVDLQLRQDRANDDPAVLLSRQADRRGTQVFFSNGLEVSPPEFQKKLSELGLADAVKTLIRQEQINDFIHLKANERYIYLANLLGRREINGDLLAGINEDFKYFFKLLIPEGDVDLSLTAHGEGAGLNVEATFPGKGTKNSMLLSGGEKTICSLALNLSIFEKLESPFYLLDEVEPSLDWSNHRHMQALLKKLAEKRQLVMITHLRSTIELADTLHGIRARRDGTSFIKFYFEMNERLLRAYKCC